MELLLGEGEGDGYFPGLPWPAREDQQSRLSLWMYRLLHVCLESRILFGFCWVLLGLQWGRGADETWRARVMLGRILFNNACPP